MSELSVREQVTAAICGSIHSSHQPETFAHVLTREKCDVAIPAAADALGVFVAKLERLAAGCDIDAIAAKGMIQSAPSLLQAGFSEGQVATYERLARELRDFAVEVTR